MTSSLVRVYHQDTLVKTHPRQDAGGRSTDAGDFPAGTDVYARRDIAKLAAYGDAVVGQACATALELDVVNVGKIKSMVEKGTGAHAAAEAARHAQAAAAAGRARFARDAREFATATGVSLHVLDGGPRPPVLQFRFVICRLVMPGRAGVVPGSGGIGRVPGARGATSTRRIRAAGRRRSWAW